MSGNEAWNRNVLDADGKLTETGLISRCPVGWHRHGTKSRHCVAGAPNVTSERQAQRQRQESGVNFMKTKM